MVSTRFLPTALALMAAYPAAAETVTVRPGDTLAGISRSFYGGISKWRAICNANFDLLRGNCDRLEVGMVLTLPGDKKATSRPSNTLRPAPRPKPPVVQQETAPTDDVEPVKSAEKATEKQGDTPSAVTSETAPLLWSWSGQSFTAPDLLRVESGQAGVTMSGYAEGLPPNGRPGIWLRLPDEIEQAVSGQTIEIALEFASAPISPVAVSYSTNDVGNSGWQRFFGDGQREARFTYAVGAINKGQGDFIGILPNATATEQSVVLTGLSVALAN